MADIMQEILLSGDISLAEVGLNIPGQPIILNTLILNQFNVPALSCCVIGKISMCVCVCVHARVGGLCYLKSKINATLYSSPQWKLGWWKRENEKKKKNTELRK